jgi:hypothetical protein
MNFTHLLPDHHEAPQETLQKYQSYLVIVVLSEEMRKLVTDTSRFDLESTSDVLCQIIMREHIEIATPGSLLDAFRRQLGNNYLVSSTDHSFMATATRSELTSHPASGGAYFPLMLNTLSNEEEKVALIKQSIADAVNRSRHVDVSIQLEKKLKVLGPAANFVAAMYRISHGIF